MWFKGCYEAEILAGRKRSTVRKASRLPRVGQVIPLSRGARKPFAYAVVTHVAPLSALSPQKASELAACFSPVPRVEDLRVIRFRVLREETSLRERAGCEV